MNNTKFNLQPEMYTQQEWFEMYLKVVEEYQKIYNKNLQQRIDKAIEYIEKNKLNNKFLGLKSWDMLEVLSILKGENDE